MAILFKATAEEAEALRHNLGVLYPAEAFSFSRVPYPVYNNIHCFEIRLDSAESTDPIREYISESLSRISASRV